MKRTRVWLTGVLFMPVLVPKDFQRLCVHFEAQAEIRNSREFLTPANR
jgi:hypothetical protein